MSAKKNTKPELTAKQKQERAIEILQQAVVNAIDQGVDIQLGNHEDKFVIILNGYNRVDGSIVACGE